MSDCLIGISDFCSWFFVLSTLFLNAKYKAPSTKLPLSLTFQRVHCGFQKTPAQLFVANRVSRRPQFKRYFIVERLILLFLLLDARRELCVDQEFDLTDDWLAENR